MGETKRIELDLIRRCQGGSEEAFDELYDRFGDAVWRICSRMSRNPADAEDLAQEVWLAVWRNIPGFRCESAFQTWLYKVASNVCLQWVREAGPRTESVEEEVLLGSSPGPEKQVVYRDLLSRTLSALGALPDSLRLPLVLKVDEGLSYAEIAEVLGCTTAAVKMRISRARASLADVLREDAV